MNLKEIGTLQDKPEYKLIDGDYPDSYIAKFTLDGNDIEVFLSNNPLSVLPQIDSIYNTNYKEEYINSYSEDFIDNLVFDMWQEYNSTLIENTVRHYSKLLEIFFYNYFKFKL